MPFDWKPLRQRWRRLLRPAWLAGTNRARPLSPIWGFDRGTPVDRYYIERFIDAHRTDIRGRVLEVHDPRYTTGYGSKVERGDVLDIDPNNPRATVVADLSTADHVPANTYDCFILTQTLQFIRDPQSALYHAHRILRPGGVLLATVPAVSRLAPHYGPERDYWRFTPAGCRELLAPVFGRGAVTVQSFGNVRAACAFLLGLAQEELPRRVLEQHDQYFPLIVAVRGVKAGTAEVTRG
jgi:SAM-dependent methyltransferase